MKNILHDIFFWLRGIPETKIPEIESLSELFKKTSTRRLLSQYEGRIKRFSIINSGLERKNEKLTVDLLSSIESEKFLEKEIESMIILFSAIEECVDNKNFPAVKKLIIRYDFRSSFDLASQRVINASKHKI